MRRATSSGKGMDVQRDPGVLLWETPHGTFRKLCIACRCLCVCVCMYV